MDDPSDTTPLADADADADAATGPSGDEPPEERPDDRPSGGPTREAGHMSWRLRRSVPGRKLKGVAGGVAAAADVDPTLVRLLFVVAAFSGWGLVAYIALAIVLQDETAGDPAQPLPRDQRRFLRIGLAVAAAIAVGRLLDGGFLDGGQGGMGLPFALIAIGAAVLWARRDERPPLPSPPPWPQALGPEPLGAGIDWSSTGRDLLRLAAAFVAIGAFLALLAGGFLVAVGAVPMRLPFLPAATGVAALVILVVSVVRRARPARLLLSGAALLIAAVMAVGLASFPGGAGERTVVVGPRTPLVDRYEHGAGRLVLDLSNIALAAGESRRVVAKVGAGELTVIVPAAVTTDIRARLGAGAASLFGREQGGAGVDAAASQIGLADAGRLDLDLRAGVGQVRVVLAAEPTFGVSCKVDQDAVRSAAPTVTCPHPRPLAARAMTCSVVLADPDGAQAGQGFCRRIGTPTPPAAGSFATSCNVPSEADIGTCEGLSVRQQDQLDASRPSTAPAPPTAGAAPPGPIGRLLTCGPPDAAGARTCTTGTAAPTSTTVAAPSFHCTEAPETGRLECVPG